MSVFFFLYALCTVRSKTCCVKIAYRNESANLIINWWHHITDKRLYLHMRDTVIPKGIVQQRKFYQRQFTKMNDGIVRQVYRIHCMAYGHAICELH